MSHERTPNYPIHPLILNRWSPRAMAGEEMTDEELFPLFEAARWAPSSYNEQPWRFIYAKRNTPEWDALYATQVEFNQSWSKDASVLVLIISQRFFERNGKPCDTHSFDTGAALENLALEAFHRGLITHGMQGFDYEKARAACNVPDTFQVEAMIAIGKPGKKENLPGPAKEKEFPSDRKPLDAIIMEGTFQ